jgi:tetratricopeptide (TPR) repeat protein
MKKIIYILLFILLPSFISAQESNLQHDSAVTLGEYTKAMGDSAYSNGNYEKAIGIYEAIIKSNGGSLQLHYNLGNAYFRNNMIGKSILNYERALRFDPTDNDAKANLEFVQSRMKDELTEQYEIFFVTWFKAIMNMLNLTTWSIIGIVAFIMFLLSVLVVLFGKNNSIRKISVGIASVSLFVTIFANISGYSLHCIVQDRNNAIIMKEEASLKSTPNNSGIVLIKVHEGRKVRITDDTMTDWKEVALEDGMIGWVPSSVLERI